MTVRWLNDSLVVGVALLSGGRLAWNIYYVSRDCGKEV